MLTTLRHERPENEHAAPAVIELERLEAEVGPALADRLQDLVHCLRAVMLGSVGRTRCSEDEVWSLRDALSRWRKVLEEQFDQVTYVSLYRPAEHRRSIPPELRRLPKPKASCDLNDGMYPFLVARAHGCLDPGDEEVSYDIPPCPEIPAGAGDGGFTDAEANSGYFDYVTTGTAGQDFFEPLTTNREDLASAASAEGPECQDFRGESDVSVGYFRLGGRPPFSNPAPRPSQSPSRQ